MKDCGNHPTSFHTRREFLTHFGAGFGGISLASLFGLNPWTSQAGLLDTKTPHFPSKVKSVIHLFASGAPSHVDSFDYKPELQKQDGIKHDGSVLLKSPFNFPKWGQSGLEISEVWSNLAQHADDMAIINSMFTDVPDHGIASKMMHTGSAQLSKPSLGSWTVYGLGCLNQNIPGFISLNGSPEWRQCAFLPGLYQGCNIQYKRGAGVSELIPNIASPFSTLERQRRQIDLFKDLDKGKLDNLFEPQLEARIESFETAFKMQSESIDAFDISKEPAAVRAMYGETENGSRMLLARRLVEKGVRFVQVHVGGWDHHSDIQNAMPRTAGMYDKAFGALLTDLKQRGMLDSTLVIWGGEFGRTVTMGGGAGSPGRDHNGKAFSVWMAGGGVKGGIKYGATDDLGQYAAQDKVHVHDLHATILHLMGFDHTKLTYNYNGREFRLTDVYGNVIKDIIA